jgi:hypothetical protein
MRNHTNMDQRNATVFSPLRSGQVWREMRLFSIRACLIHLSVTCHKSRPNVQCSIDHAKMQICIPMYHV